MSEPVGNWIPLQHVTYFQVISAVNVLVLSLWPALYWIFFSMQMYSYLPFLYFSVNAIWTEIIESPDHTFIFMIYYAV